MRIGVSEQEVLCTTQETEPSNVIGSSLPVSSEPAQALAPNPAFGLGGASSTFAGNGSSPISFAPAVSSAPVQSLGTATSASGPSKFGPMQPSTFPSDKTCALPPHFSYPCSVSTPFGPTQDFAKTGGVCASSTTLKNPFQSFLHPGFGVGPNPQNVPGRGSFLDGVETQQGSRFPRYAPTPDLDSFSGGQGKLIISKSASNSHGHKSHEEELRWEDYKMGDKACGATSSSSPSGHLDLNGTTNLAGLFFSTNGSCPLLFGTPNLAAYGITTTPPVQAYAMIFGTPNLTAQCTTTSPAAQTYPVHGLTLVPFAAMSLQ